MDRQLEIEAGVPVSATVDGEGDVYCAALPAGPYATVTHVGHPDGLVDVTTALLRWAADRGLDWDTSETDDGERWACRLEVYRTNPAEQHDLNAWETDLVFKLAG
jgi:effector-binding domain-containing protein